jgi:outer membrane assembly lipoprotein YfiO
VEQAEELYRQKRYRATQTLLQQFLLDRPGSRYREEAMYWLGRSELELNQEYEAEERFQGILRDFPGGEFAPQANFYLGVALQEQSRPPYLDQSETLAALARFQSFVTRYPDHELAPEAEQHIGELRDKLAQKAYLNGRTYLKRGFYFAAEYYFKDKVVIPYADTRWAPRANLDLIQTYGNAKRYEDAVTWANYLVTKFPDAPQAELATELQCKYGLELAQFNETLYREAKIAASGEEALRWATFVVGECPGTGDAKKAREIARKMVDAGITPAAAQADSAADPGPD